jgi:hypothetical protein
MHGSVTQKRVDVMLLAHRYRTSGNVESFMSREKSRFLDVLTTTEAPVLESCLIVYGNIESISRVDAHIY